MEILIIFRHGILGRKVAPHVVEERWALTKNELNFQKYHLVNYHSYLKWPFIVDFPFKMVIFHSYVSLPEGTSFSLRSSPYSSPALFVTQPFASFQDVFVDVQAHFHFPDSCLQSRGHKFLELPDPHRGPLGHHMILWMFGCTARHSSLHLTGDTCERLQQADLCLILRDPQAERASCMLT